MTGDITQKIFADAIQEATRVVLSDIGGTFDRSATEFCRSYFMPTTPRGRALPKGQFVKGAPVPFHLYLSRILEAAKANCDQKQQSRAGKEKPHRHPNKGTVISDGKNLVAWVAQYGKSYNLEGLFDEIGLVKASRPAGGKFIKCFHDLHSGSEEETFVVNGDGDKGYVLYCSGASGGCPDIADRALRLREYMKAGHITWQHLEDEQYGGGPISARMYNHKKARSKKRKSLRVVDKAGRGLDVAVFHSALSAQRERMDFESLNRLCGTQVDVDVTAEQLADFIRSGRIMVVHLEQCFAKFADGEVDPYLARLAELAEKTAKGMSGREVDVELGKIQNDFHVKIKTLQADFKRAQSAEAECQGSVPGALSEEDSKALCHGASYAERFCILNAGGKAMVMNMAQPDVTKSLMTHQDFAKLHRDDWYQGEDENGNRKVFYPADTFLQMPPDDVQFYRGGMVFKPSGTVAADQYNLYQGMLIEPDSSGSCSLLHELITDVWCNGCSETAAWVMEWLMHIVAYPGAKVGTSIAIRGGYGDGKSIVFERLLSTILGDMLLRIANQRLVLGDFNESMLGKLVIVLEEAAFAGDKAAFDKMKEIVTSNTVHINPKFKAPITVDNHARMLLVSNHDHILHIKPGDRRYTVLESNNSWVGTDKFGLLLEQWDNGGAARFVYESLNHQFRRFGDGQKLVISTNLKTDAAVRQIAQSRSSLEKAIVTLLLRGSLERMRMGGDAFEDKWLLDDSFDIESHKLEDAVCQWLADFDARAAQHETTLHVIISKLEQFIGKTETDRPKATAGGSRVQLPTVRLLPCRRAALKHALDGGYITKEEFDSALPPGE